MAPQLRLNEFALCTSEFSLTSAIAFIHLAFRSLVLVVDKSHIQIEAWIAPTKITNCPSIEMSFAQAGVVF